MKTIRTIIVWETIETVNIIKTEINIFLTNDFSHWTNFKITDNWDRLAGKIYYLENDLHLNKEINSKVFEKIYIKSLLKMFWDNLISIL
jgi:hypothetical protein